MATTVPDAPQVATMQPAREQARAEFADLLRSRRGRLTPADVGLPAGARRRTPGLRREEVAQLAGVSTTYYTFLEQGRDVRPSRQVLAALARALRLRAPASPEVRSWWPRHDVLPVAGGMKRLHHPAVGDVTFQHVVLQVADRPEQTLVSFTSADVAEEALARLASGIR